MLRSRTLDALAGGSVAVKAECYQRTGSFKFRGAYARIASTTADERRRGFIVSSSGNHGQAVALAATLVRSHATVVMPADAPSAKKEAVARYGGTIVTCDRYRDDRAAIALALASERGLLFVPAFDDPLVIAGQGTTALELLEDVGELDMLIVPVGGGGLMAGCAVAARALVPRIDLVGVEPEVGDDTRRSLAAGRRVRIRVLQTVADGLQLAEPGELTFEINHRLLSDVVTVDDAEIVAAMVFLFEHMKVVAEPSGAAALAAVLAGKVATKGRRIGVVVSGGNVGADRFCELLRGAGRRLAGDAA